MFKCISYPFPLYTFGGFKINQEEVKTICKMRSRVTEVKTNFRGKYESFECVIYNKNT